MNDTAIIPGSLRQIAQRDGMSLAESFLNVDAIILVDVSGSMDTCDSWNNQRRYDVALQELARLQNTMPGKLGIVAFASSAQFVPSGVPPLLGSGTNLASALQFVRVADTGDIRFMVISDGQPDNAEAALREATKFRGRIDTIYVGPEGGQGAEFLRRLATAHGGQTVTAAQAHELAAKAEHLLLAA